ncbi:MAG: triose-phosphate isomerase [Acidobacteriota bacterium]|jgi:triosephosphate isomerase
MLPEPSPSFGRCGSDVHCDRNASANRVVALSIRGALAERFGEAVAQAVRVQYGGSVNVDNIDGFMAMPEIDGALVGGASLTPDFVELVRRAARPAPASSVSARRRSP